MLKTIIKRVFSVFLATVLLVSGSGIETVFATPLPEEETVVSSTPIAQGYCGPNSNPSAITWEVTSNSSTPTYTLTLTGSGDMASSNSYGWNEYKDKINKIIVGEGITALGSYAFSNCGTYEKVSDLFVSLPSTLTYIGYNSFSQCKNLTDIFIPGNVVNVSKAAFLNCDHLSKICFWGNTQSDKALYIGDEAFKDCKELLHFTFPRYLKKLGSNSFSGCHYSMHLYYPAEGITYDGTFYKRDGNDAHNALFSAYKSAYGSDLARPRPDSNIIKYGSISDDSNELAFNLNKYGSLSLSGPDSGSASMRSFNDLSAYPWSPDSISTVTFRGKIKSIGNNAFKNMSSLESIYLSSDALNSIGDCAFSGCTGLTYLSYNMGSSNLSIGKQAFDNCNKLKDFSFTSGDNKSRISSIGQEAFRNCKALTSLNLESYSDLLQGQGVFTGCSGLKTVKIDIAKNNSTKYNIPADTFRNCTKLENVTITRAGTIDTDSFRGCTSLKSIDTGGAKEVNIIAFSECSNLTDFTVGASLTNLSGPITDKPNPALRFSVNGSNETFHATEDGDMIIKTSTTVVLGSGTDPVVPEGVTAIAQGAFQNHTGLVTIDLPASLTVIDGYAFYGCSNLREKIYRGGDWSNVNIGDHNDPIKNADLTVISREGDFAENQLHWEFSDYEKELAITDNSSGCTVIPDFNNSTDRAPWYIWRPDIKKINGDFITEVGNYAFYGCRKLPSAYPGIKLGGVSSGTGGLTRIGKYAFGNCSSLTFFKGFDGDDLDGFRFAAAGGTVEENAFNNCIKLEEIDTREEKVTLAAGSFNGCSSLKKVVIGKDTAFEAPLTDTPNSLEELYVADVNGSYSGSDDHSYIMSKDKKTLLLCTKDCTDIPDGIETIGTGAFYNLNSLQTVTIPSSVKKIEANAFFGCTGLEQINYLGNEDAWANIDISDTGNSILNKSNINFLATEGDIECEGGTLHWNIEDKPILGEITKTLVFTVKDGTVTSLNDFESALNVPWSASATRIQRVEADFLTSVGAYSFCNFTKVKNDNFVLTSMVKAGAHSFENCDTLDTVVNYSSIKEIGDHAFSHCDGFTTLNGLSALTTIGGGAFAKCGNLEEIHISDKVTSIGAGILKNCPKLKNIVVTDSERYKGNALNQILLQIDGAAVTILAVVPTVVTLDLSGTGITDIGESALSGCTLLENIILPDDLKSIGDRAFEDCGKLESFTVPAGVEQIGASVFSGCEKLTELKSNSEKFKAENNTLVETETKTLVAGCNGSTAIPDGVEIIGDGAFEGCSLITVAFTIPSSVKKIGSSAFSGCSAIKDTVNLSGISEVGDSAFEGCESITKVILPVITADSVFGNAVFKGCINLETVTIPNGLTLIPDSTFEDCFSIKRVNIPKSVETIGKNAFKGTSLETVNYDGTRSAWARIIIRDGNDELTSALINCSSEPSSIPSDPDDVIYSYYVTYMPGFEGPAEISEKKNKGDTIDLNPSLFVRDGFTLTGWKDEDGAVYAPDQSGIAVNSNMTFTAQWSSAVESPTKVISKPVTIMDSNGNEININMDIELTKAVSFNGLKHEWTDGKAGGKASPDITVKISGGIENYADIKKIKIKNNKNASADSSKKPAVIITLKPTGSDKAVKKSLNEINKTLKKDTELTFEIKPLDLTYMGDSLHAVPNGKKTKLKKLTADVPTGSSTKTVKLSKKDFSVDQIDAENGTATITGKGNCKGTVTLKF